MAECHPPDYRSEMKRIEHIVFTSLALKMSGTRQALMGLVLALACAAPYQALMAAGPASVNLGSTAPFTILAGTTITTTGGGTITGDVGLYPGPGSAQLVPPNQVIGTIYERDATGTAGANVVINAVLLNTAVNDLGVAMTDAAGRTPVPTGTFLNPLNPVSGNLAGLNLPPGLYKITTTALLQGTAGSVLPDSVLTLTGGPSDVWIFQCGQDLEVYNDVILAGGAQAGNVFWQVASDANIFSGVTFNGTILSGTSVTLYSTSVLNGRALASAEVAFDGASGTLPTPANPVQGSLQVNLAPSNAVSAGAQWQVDGGSNQNSGTTLTNLSPGSHIVSFTPVAGWIAPSNQTAIIVSSETTTNNGLYVLAGTAPAGVLSVNLLPAGAVAAGAQWQVDGGSNENSGATITNLSAGSYIVSFKPVFGWITPSNQTAIITNSETTTNIGLYSITNSFISARGSYNGLFSATNGVTEQTAGMLRSLTLGTNGIYSGTLLINGASHVIRGVFNAEGQAGNSIARKASQGGNLALAMTLSVNKPLQQVTGTVSGTNDGAPWVAYLIADLATNTVPEAEYTMLLPPDMNNDPPAMSPGGDSYFLITNYTGTARNPASATVRITGALADGAAFNQSVPVSQDGYVPMYASLYAGKGLLLGWINLDLTNTTGVSLTWIRPEHASGMYKNGFTNVLLTDQILLSLWADPPPAGIDLLTDLSMLETIDDPIALTNYTLTINRNFAFGDVSESPLVSGSISPKTGFFKVTISIKGPVMSSNGGNVLKGNEGIMTNGNEGTPLTSYDGSPLPGSVESKLTGYGAILQNANNGGGYLLTTTNALAIKLQPQVGVNK